VGPDGPESDPGALGGGWVGFDFEKAFAKRVLVVNDAAMQALGADDGGRMLFLGLGTGLGSALVTDRVVIPLELGSLPYHRGETMADRLGRRGLKEHGESAWKEAVAEAVGVLRRALAVDYVVLGGGNASLVDPLPDGARQGGNEDAFTGGFRLWEEEVVPHDVPPAAAWRVVR
jgi:polyphosphate glucokinase